MDVPLNFDLIVTIVNKGWSERILKASKAAGAEGGTIIFGRGIGVRESQTIFGIPIEPEKEIILTAICQEMSDDVLKAIMKAGQLEKPGTGVAFVIELKKVVGIFHLCNPGDKPK